MARADPPGGAGLSRWSSSPEVADETAEAERLRVRHPEGLRRVARVHSQWPGAGVRDRRDVQRASRTMGAVAGSWSRSRHAATSEPRGGGGAGAAGVQRGRPHRRVRAQRSTACGDPSRAAGQARGRGAGPGGRVLAGPGPRATRGRRPSGRSADALRGAGRGRDERGQPTGSSPAAYRACCPLPRARLELGSRLPCRGPRPRHPLGVCLGRADLGGAAARSERDRPARRAPPRTEGSTGGFATLQLLRRAARHHRCAGPVGPCSDPSRSGPDRGRPRRGVPPRRAPLHAQGDARAGQAGDHATAGRSRPFLVEAPSLHGPRMVV